MRRVESHLSRSRWRRRNVPLALVHPAARLIIARRSSRLYRRRRRAGWLATRAGLSRRAPQSSEPIRFHDELHAAAATRGRSMQSGRGKALPAGLAEETGRRTYQVTLISSRERPHSIGPVELARLAPATSDSKRLSLLPEKSQPARASDRPTAVGLG